MSTFKKLFSKSTLKSKQGERNIIFIIVIFIALLLNIAGNYANFRFDLTRNNAYSLSDKSKGVLKNVDDKFKIKVLFSDNLPGEHKKIFRYVEDLMKEYDFYGSSDFSFEVIRDKEKLQDEAKNYGIRPVRTRELVDDQVKSRAQFMALVFQHANLIEKIDSVLNVEGLEFKITSKIDTMLKKAQGLRTTDKIQFILYQDSRLAALNINGYDQLENYVKAAITESNKINYSKITFKVVDPSKDKNNNAVRKYGVQKITWKDRGRTNEAIVGMVIDSGKKFKTMPLQIARDLFGRLSIAGINTLKDTINKEISNFYAPNKKVGYIMGHGIGGFRNQRDPAGATLLKQVLSENYSLIPIDLTKTSIAKAISTLIVNGPKDKLSDREIYHIDQFIMKGGSVIFFADSHKEVKIPGMQNRFRRQQPIILKNDTGIEALIKHYGVTLNADKVLDKNCSKAPFGQELKDYYVMPKITRDGFNQDNVITKFSRSAIMYRASSLSYNKKDLKKKKISVTDLITSSPESWLMRGRINYNPMMMNPPKGKGFQSYPLAVLLEGKFDSFFKNKKIPEKEVDKKKTKQPKKPKNTILGQEVKIDRTIESKDSKILIVSTSEITSSGFINFARKMLQSGKRNESFANDLLLHSMIDYMTGNDFIPEMKSKSVEYNPLEKTTETKRLVFKIINIGGLPILIIILGIVIWRRRNARKLEIMNTFSGGSK